MSYLSGQRQPEKNPTEIYLYSKILFTTIARHLENTKFQQGNTCRNFYSMKYNIQPLKEGGRSMHASTYVNWEKSQRPYWENIQITEYYKYCNSN